MDALTLLKADHREVEGLFREIDDLGPRASTSRARIFEKIDQALSLHAQAEEKYFYPALKERAKSDERLPVLEAYEEHAIVKTLLAELQRLDPSDETYVAKLAVLEESVLHHVKEEESEIFKIARELLDANELRAVGEQIAAFKQHAGAAA
jgi:hemerythrin superfamily protein